jgi:hypothetical protein
VRTDSGHHSYAPPSRRPRRVAERGLALGRLDAVLVDITDWDVKITCLLIVSRSGGRTWYRARGHQADLLDENLFQQTMKFTWERFECSSHRYIASPVMVMPPEGL